MSTQIKVSELIENAEQLNPEELDHFIKKVLVLRAKRTSPVLSKKESDLLNQINKGYSDIKWERIELLNDKLEEGVLDSKGKDELDSLLESYEKYTVQRLRYLGQLAELRKVTLRDLMIQLGMNQSQGQNG